MIETAFIIFFIVSSFIALFVWLNSRFKSLADNKEDAVMLEWLKTTQGDLKQLQQSLSDTISKSNYQMTNTLQQQTKDIHDRLTRAAEVIGELKREAGAFSEVGRSMKDLQEFLKSPKLRGNIGEQVLNDLVSQMFPKQSFHIQYKFKSGQTVDIALQTDAGILPIDSKFPMENFQRMIKAETEAEKEVASHEFTKDVKKHVDAISSKYILPEEGTMDFALMYVPSESVYYEIVNNMQVMDHARSCRVYVVSPSTLYAHLQTILLSFEGKKLEHKTKEVMKLLRSVQKDYEKTALQLSVANRHVTNAFNAMSSLDSSFSKLGQKIEMTAVIDTTSDAVLPEPSGE